MMKTLAPQRCIPRTSQPAHRSSVMFLDRLVGRVRMRLVVHGQDHAGDRLDDERGQGRGAERVAPADVAGNLAEEEVANAADEPRPLLEPVERVQEESESLVFASWLALGHQRGGWTG